MRAALAVWSLLPLAVAGFQPVGPSRCPVTRSYFAEQASICDIPSGKPGDTPVDVAMLRAATLTSASGQPVTLGNRMGDEVSLVVFLRYLG